LQAATRQGHTEIVHILLKYGAGVNAAGGKHGTLLEIATKHGYNRIVTLLRARGARGRAPLENEEDEQQ
jgi:ankyrin repeat protein